MEAILVGRRLLPKEQKSPLLFRHQRPKVIVISGPTCCGKTELSLFLARALRGEIVSADAIQVYKGMNIGSAKATKQQRSHVPHHLLDIRKVNEPMNVADYYSEARHILEKLVGHGITPIVVGGSGFYLNTLIYGPPNGPSSVPQVRAALEHEADRLGIKVLFERLAQQDPHYAETITPCDRQKIIRALEIMTLSGQKVSSTPWRQRKSSIGYDFRCWFLNRSRDSLYKRIDKRCDQMLEAGLLEEVAELDQNGLRQNPSAAQAIGYRQSLEFLASNRSPEDYEAFVKQFKQATRRYVKRQFTWFRKENLFRWLDMDLHDMETAVDIIIQDFKRDR